MPDRKKKLQDARQRKGKLTDAKAKAKAAKKAAPKPAKKPIGRAIDAIKKLIDKVIARIKKIRSHKHHSHHKPGPTVMYDSVTVDAIPSDAKAVGCYVGPSIITCPEVSQKFPKAIKVRITQAGLTTTPADCVDVEPGDATNDTGTTWVKRQLAAGVKRPIVYTSASNVNALLGTLSRAGVSRSQVRVWAAHYGRGEHICSPSVCGYPEADATQWTSTALGRNLDQSKLKPNFFG